MAMARLECFEKPKVARTVMLSVRKDSFTFISMESSKLQRIKYVRTVIFVSEELH